MAERTEEYDRAMAEAVGPDLERWCQDFARFWGCTPDEAWNLLLAEVAPALNAER